MKKWQRLVVWFMGGVVLVAALVAVIAPGVIKSQAIKRVEAATGRKLTIGRVVVNPFTLTAGADGVTLAEKGSGAPFVSFSSARVSISPRSLYKGVPVVSSVQLVSPFVSIVRSGDNTYNFSDMLEKKEDAAPEKKEKTEFCINNISISRGTVVFRDRALPAEKIHTVSDLNLSLPFISTIPYLADRYITPRLSAVVNGAPLRLDGKLKKLPASAEMIMNVNLKELSLPWYMPYLPAKAPVSVPTGTLSAAAGVTYRVSAKAAPQLIVGGTATLSELSVKEKGGGPLLFIKSGSVAMGESDFFAGRYDVNSLNLDGLEVHLVRDRQGTWNFSRLASASSSPQPKKGAAAKKGKAPAVHVAAATLRNGCLLFTDHKPSHPFSTKVERIAVDLARYSSEGEAPADFSLSFATERGEKLALKGTQSSVPLAVKSSVTVEELSLASYYPYLSEWLTAPVTGKVGVKGDVVFSRDTGLLIEKANISATSLGARFAGEEGVKISRLSLEEGSLNLKERRFGLERITVRGSDLKFSRDEQGALSPLKLIRETPAVKRVPAPVASKEKEKPFAWSIGSITGENMKFSFRDGTIEDDPPEFMLRKTSMSLKNLESTGRRPVPFRLAASYGDEGALSASGDMVLQPSSIRGNLRLKKIPLTDFAPYLPDNFNITVADGSVDVTGRVNLTKKGTEWSGAFGGALGVRSFYCLDAEDDDLLKWESLQLEGVSGTVGPFALAINDVVLNHYFAKIIIEKDGSLNLQHLADPVDEQGTAAVPPAPAPPRDAPQQVGQPSPQPASPKNIKVGAVVLQDGILNFTDNHLNPTYSTTFYNLGGRVSGLTSETNRFADVDLRGNLENQSPLRITGQINPLRDDLFVNLTMRFTDIEMSPLSPYSSTYLGYLIDKGKLFLDLKYHIERKKLESQNTVFLDQLTLGEKVDSPRATSLPVRLAIALLKDRKGEIHLDLPVSGRTDDPRFSVWGVLLQMLKNIAVKAATAPFALLQSLFGGSEDFGGVNFTPGSSKLPPGEQEKLTKLAAALKDRPALKIEMTGFVDRETDPEGLRKELLEKKIRTEKFLELVKEKKNRPGDSPETMQITPEEYPKYLKLVYRKEKFPKPRTIIGLVKDLPEPEMKKLIFANTVIGTKDLQALAVDRTTAVRDFLVERGALDAGRIFQKTGDIFKEPAKKGEAGSRVEFGMAAQ